MYLAKSMKIINALPRYSIIVHFEDLFAFLISGSLHNKQHYTTAHNNNLLFWLMVHRFIRVFDFSISNIKGIAMYHHTKTIIYYQYLYDLLKKVTLILELYGNLILIFSTFTTMLHLNGIPIFFVMLQYVL